MKLIDYPGTKGTGADYGIVTHECVECGGNVFWLAVTFFEYEISSYSLDMECVECHSRYKAPTPLDNPTE